MDLVVDHHNDGSVDYITEQVMHLKDKEDDNNAVSPSLKVWQDGKVVLVDDKKASPKFIVVELKKEAVSWGKAGTPCCIYKMVLMDGSETCFKAVTNSSLAMLLHGENLCAGCTVVVKDFSWLWFQTERRVEWQGTMFIKNMGWNYPPGFAMAAKYFTPPAKKVKRAPVIEYLMQASDDGTAAEVEPSHKVFRAHRFAIDKVIKRGVFLFTTVWIDKPERYIWNHQCSYEASQEHFENGDWIHSDHTRGDWIHFMKPLMEEEKAEDLVCAVVAEDLKPAAVVDSQDSKIPFKDCECQTRFGFTKCVLFMFPVEDVPKDELFVTCRHHLLGKNIKTYGKKFGGLLNNHKRWCLYWHYAVNIFEIRSSARPLPECFTDYVRFIYPNAGEKPFCGFKSTEERAMVRSRGASIQSESDTDSECVVANEALDRLEGSFD